MAGPAPSAHFASNIAYVRNLLALARSIDAATTAAVDVGDIQRAAIVMAVSALDHYVHEKARQGMQEVLDGSRARTAAFERFPVSMSLLLDARSDPAGDGWLDGAVRVQHGHRPFLKTEDIADAIRLISDVKLWECVGQQLGTPAATVKVRLQTIVDRRNKIAHEADLDPTLPGRRWPITDRLASDAVDYVVAVVEAIEASA
ncbi:MAG: hypothetical protein M3401_01100 [Actinomycetota bacterium]|nr:hypothetical protein [Actinomycetota bacterium]